MSEEKKAIKTLKEVASDDFDTLGDDISPKMAQNILNLIDKQQKEIEEKNIAINKMSKDISRQLEEIEEKSTIIMAGAEKVKQLEKEIEELKEKNKNLIFQLKDEEKELIEVTDKIREKINYYRKYCGYDGVTMIGNTQLKELEELLEENDE